MKKIGKAIARKFKNWKGTTNAKGDNIEESRSMTADVEKIKIDVEEQINVDKDTETDTRSCEDINKNSEDLNIEQSICESSEKARNTSKKQEPNVLDSPSSTACFDSDAAGEKPSTRQRQAILAGSAGIVLLVGSIVSCILKIHTITVVGWIAGSSCIGFVLYNSFKPNTKLEKVEDVEQPIVKSSLNPT